MSLHNPNPAEKAFLAIFNEPTPSPSNDTKTRAERKAEYEKRAGARTPTAEIVARIEAAERILWIPHSYVLFVRLSTCKTCNATERVLDIPRLFLQQRAKRRDESNPYLYTPVKGIEFHTLPRRLVVTPITVPYCLACFEDTSCPVSQDYQPDATELHIDELARREETLSSQETSSGHPLDFRFSEPSTNSMSSTSEVAFGGTPSETGFGSGQESER